MLPGADVVGAGEVGLALRGSGNSAARTGSYAG